MASIRAQFEGDLKQKLQQKSTSHTSEETVLVRAFKYFDLDDSGMVTFEEFVKAVEKIGVVVADRQQLRGLFRQYDVDSSGSLDYKEFAAVMAGGSGPRGSSPEKSIQLASIDKLRKRLAARGGRGIIGLARQFKIIDDDNSHCLDMNEFSKAMHDFRVELSAQEIDACFEYVDRNRSGTIDYDEFLRAVRGPMNNFRQLLVQKAFSKLDRDGSGIIELDDIRGFYNARAHPDVRSGKKTEDAVLAEFLETFEMHHNIQGVRDGRVTQEEFFEYYNNISSSIDNDQYFELMMNNAWRLTEAPAYTRNKAWASEEPTGQPKPPPKRGPATTLQGDPAYSRSVQMLFDRFRKRVAARGARGIIGIARSFRVMDDDKSQTISPGEFRKACRDFRIELDEADTERLFRALDRDGNGTIDYEELLRGIRGPMNPFRQNLVRQAWEKIDRDGNGVLDINDIRGIYSARSHPEVRSGRRTEDDVLGEFLETFEAHHNMRDSSGRDRSVTYEEFTEYYNNVSASIDDDRYFETMMTTAWRLGEKLSAGDPGYSYTRGIKRTYPQGKVPYGVSEEFTDWSTSNNKESASELLRKSQGTRAAGGAGSGGTEGLFAKLKSKLAARGSRGFIGLARQFKIMDDDGSGCLNQAEFAKAMRDFRVDLAPDETQQVFQYMDADRSGTIQYEEFIHRIRGELNSFRRQLVSKAFGKLDKNGNGVVELDDIKGVYNAKNHPDVKSRQKTEDDILCEFLDTFEAHHATFKQDTRDRRITLDEFLEYYSHVSASIDDDRYFELMMNNTWNFEGKTYEKGWGGDYTSPARRAR